MAATQTAEEAEDLLEGATEVAIGGLIQGVAGEVEEEGEE